MKVAESKLGYICVYVDEIDVHDSVPHNQELHELVAKIKEIVGNVPGLDAAATQPAA